MITVVSNSADREIPFNENAFPGMNLVEACAESQVQVANIINEMNMGILLSEHTYLYENGVEVSYFNEDGNETKDAKNVKNIINEKMHAAAQVMNDLWDKLISWITDHCMQVRNALVKAGFNEHKFDNVLNEVKKENPNFILKLHQANTVDYEGFKSKVEEGFASDAMNWVDDVNKIAPNTDYNKNIFEEFVKSNVDEAYTIHDIAVASERMFTSKIVINEIKQARKDANRSLNDFKKLHVEAKEDGMSAYLDQANAAIRANNKAVRDAVKVYHAYITEQVNIVRGFLKTPEAKAVMHPHAAQAKEDAAEKKARKQAENDEKKMNESVMYNGKFFRV